MSNTAKAKKLSSRQIAVALFVVVTLLGVGAYAFLRTPLYTQLATTRLVYSESAVVQETWTDYKKSSIEDGSSRTIDDHTSNVTTSNAHSLTLLRSVWVDDKQTFDKAWAWSKQNEQLENKLFASSYGPRADKTYGIIDATTDSTADTNIALALLMAYGRWDDTAYLTDAKAIIASLYDNSVIISNGSPVLADSAISRDAVEVPISPATMNIAAFKEFAKVDPSHDWTGLANNTYEVYEHLLLHNDNVTPNAATVATIGHHYTLTEDDEVFTQRAATGLWNLGLDYAWNHDERSLALMKKLTLAQQYRTNGEVLAGSSTESAVTYGKLIGYFNAVDPSLARTVAKDKLLSQYTQDRQSFITPLPASDQSWLWLGIASDNGQLQHLTEIK